MIWRKTPIDAQAVKELARRYGIELLTAAIFTRRGITTPEELRYYLSDDMQSLHNPFLMPAMADAVDRINAAIDSEESILIFGDRDVDGITATVLLHEALSELGARVQWMLPEGEEMYGLSEKAVDRAADMGVSLIVTVDCGVSNTAEIAHAGQRGIECVVIDHHNPPEELPEAVAIVDPKLPGYPFRDLCGCAVASKVEWALRFSRSSFYGASLCLLNARPANETLMIEAVRLVNLVETSRVMENVVPGMVPLEKTRLAGFINGDEVLVMDAGLHTRLFANAFGPDAVPSFSDIAPLVSQFLPDMAGKSLLGIQQALSTARFSSRPVSEIDTLRDLFSTLVLQRENERLAPAFARLDLVALATLADLMPLTDENRVLVRSGLNLLRASERHGLRQVFRRKDLLGKKISAFDIAWQVSPLLNSAGRMGEPETATRLFLAATPEEADGLVEQLFALDNRRKSMGESSWNALLGQAKESLEKSGGRCVLVHDEKVQRGITGIMASRMQAFFKTPAIVIAEAGEVAVGSIRCNHPQVIAGFFARHGQEFMNYGGHDFAGGFSMERGGLQAFLDSFYTHVEDLIPPASDAEETISIDAEIPLTYLSPDLQKTVDLFEPYGEGNPGLAFLTKGMRVAHCELIGRNSLNHLKLLLEAGRTKWPAVYWNAALRFPGEFTVGDTVDVVYRLGRNTYGGGENLQLTILDLHK